MSMYSMFQTDKGLECNGVVIDYGSFRVTIARAGGGNKKYAKSLEQLTKPYRRAIQTESLDNEISMDILRKAVAQSIVLDWEVKQEQVGDDAPSTEKWLRGIENERGELLPLTEENVVETFRKLPDLFLDIQQQAGKVSLYRRQLLEDDAGN